jgi:hypothetical protein
MTADQLPLFGPDDLWAPARRHAVVAERLGQLDADRCAVTTTDDRAAGATLRQLRYLAIARQHQFGGVPHGRSRWFSWVQAETGRALTSNRSLTKVEASQLIDRLIEREEHDAG